MQEFEYRDTDLIVLHMFIIEDKETKEDGLVSWDLLLKLGAAVNIRQCRVTFSKDH